MSERSYNIKLDLSKLKNTGACKLVGRTGEKVCVVIPVEDNNIFLSEKGGMYLDLTATAMKEERYGQTHFIRKSIPSDVYKEMSDDDKKAVPIIGSLSPIKAKSADVSQTGQVADGSDDLPF